MSLLFVLLFLFLGIGLIAHQDNTWIRLLLVSIIACILLLLYLT